MTPTPSIDALANPNTTPSFPRGLWLALAVSLLLHAALLVGQRLDISPMPELKPLSIRMVRTAPDLKVDDQPPPPPASKLKQGQPKPPPAPAQHLEPATLPDPPKVEEAPPEPGVEQAAQDQPEAAPSPTPPQVTQFSGTAWPRAGRITFALLMGEQRFPAGKATHQWEVTDDGKYRIEALTEPADVALIPWFKPGRTKLISVGRVTPQGLQPETFVEKREGRPGDVRVDMDWAANEIRVAGAKAPLLDNTQDVLSFLYQLGYPGAPALGEMPVTTGGRVDGYRFEVVGEEQLDMPFGETWRTLHVRARYGVGKEVTEVWLATERFGLPVKVRNVDAKGVVYYLMATNLRWAVPAVDP